MLVCYAIYVISTQPLRKVKPLNHQELKQIGSQNSMSSIWQRLRVISSSFSDVLMRTFLHAVSYALAAALSSSDPPSAISVTCLAVLAEVDATSIEPGSHEESGECCYCTKCQIAIYLYSAQEMLTHAHTSVSVTGKT